MAAGLQPLRYDRIDAPAFQPARFGDGGRRRQHKGAGRLDADQQIIWQQAEMETDDSRPKLLDQFGGALQPHFAYGALDKKAYATAHAMHVYNHLTEFSVA